ncbi:MAG: branched-chain amino acid ABC transporter permease [Candidatus Thorarchaeota archaeon]
MSYNEKINNFEISLKSLVKPIMLFIIVIVCTLWTIEQIMEDPGLFLARIVRTIVYGLPYSMLLFLMVSGFYLIFGLGDVINFAHGAFFMLGGFIGYEIYMYLYLNVNIGFFSSNMLLWSFICFISGIIGTVVILGIIGGGIEVLTIRRLYGNPIGQILLTVGYSVIIVKIADLLWSSLVSKTIPNVDAPVFFISTVTINPFSFVPFDAFQRLSFKPITFFIFIIGIILAILMFLFFLKTKFGLLIQASLEDREMVEILGIDIKKLLTLVFIAGACLAGFAGFLIVPWVGAKTEFATQFLLYAFVIVVVGGAHYGKFEGSFFGSLIIGMAYYFSITFFTLAITYVITFLIMVVVLIFKPNGLTGQS